jgi:hypothetical protein
MCAMCCKGGNKETCKEKKKKRKSLTRINLNLIKCLRNERCVK